MRIARCYCCSVKTACLVLGVLLILGNLIGRSKQIIQIFILHYNLITCYTIGNIYNRQALAISKWVFFARIPLIAWSYLRMWGHLDNVLYLRSDWSQHSRACRCRSTIWFVLYEWLHPLGIVYYGIALDSSLDNTRAGMYAYITYIYNIFIS